MIISRKEFAEELNVTISCVNRYANDGLPVVKGGVDREEGLAWVRQHRMPQHGIRSGKGADAAYAIYHGHSDFDASASAESVLAPIADAVWQEVVKLGAHVAGLVESVDDPGMIREIARREAAAMLTRLSQLEVGHE